MTKAPRRLIPAIPLLLACLPLACNRPALPAGGGEDHAAPVRASAVHLEKAMNEWTELVGTTQPLPGAAARITVRVEGTVISPLQPTWYSSVGEGRRVQADQVIVRLDDRAARANRDRLAATAAGLDEQERQAEIAEKKAEIDVTSLQGPSKGVPKSGVPQIDLDKAILSLDEAQSRRRAVASSKASLAAELKALDVQLGYFTVRSPIDGRLGQFLISPGQNVPSGTTVVDVANLEEIDILCAVPPHTAARLKVGQKAQLVDDPAVVGTLSFIAVQAQPETGNFAVKVRVPNEHETLRLNSVVRVHVQTKPAMDRWVIEEAALMEDEEKPAVIVAEYVTKKADGKEVKDENGKEVKAWQARKLLAELGVRDRKKHVVEITGLKTPDKGEAIDLQGVKFIVAGAHGLKDGDEVKIEDEKKD